MRITPANIRHAIVHPFRAIRYLCHRDVIAYSTIARYLPPNPVIVEAGAHDGTNTVEMAEFWTGATVHAFEPLPAAADVVDGKIRRFGSRVHCHRLGLGPRNGSIEMHVSGDGSSGASQSSSMLEPTTTQLKEFPDIPFGLHQTVQMRTIDSWADAHGVDRVDFLWLDMQGYELEALSGATRMLPGVSAIHMEVCNVELYHRAPLYTDVKRRLAAWRFRPVVEAIFRVSGNVLFARTA